VWVSVHIKLRWRESGPLERVGHTITPPLARFPYVMDHERFFDRLANAEAGIERLVRILVDDLHPLAKRS
jgi:hypothetical protein